MNKKNNSTDNDGKARITWRDQLILKHVARYRLTTVNVAQRSVLRQYSRNAVAKQQFPLKPKGIKCCEKTAAINTCRL
jgi:hypothetical protein